MGCEIEVLFAPAEFGALRQRNLAESTCVVFDVLRATSTVVTALANGATGFMPVEEISEAIALRRERPDALLAGERDGLPIPAALAGGMEFDLGNSPREFTPAKVQGRTIISTTTNGTRALRACIGAEAVVIGSFLNLSATADYVVLRKPRHLLLVCAGTGDGAALEDTLAAGALCDYLRTALSSCELLDSAEIATSAYRQARGKLSEVVQSSQNARRLLASSELREDVEFCLRANVYPFAAVMIETGLVKRWQRPD
jgi:2-phosphosulfolactate phosphatase